MRVSINHPNLSGFISRRLRLGAYLSTPLASMQRQGPGLTIVPQMCLIIIISSGVLDGKKPHEWKDCYSKPIKCPSVHFLGMRDFLLPRNEKLLQKFDNPIAIWHKARHTVPKLDATVVLPMKKFLECMLSASKEEQEGRVREHPTSSWTHASCAALA
ncbi:hypothetical protein L7F22_057689 [Adiantum nelumboides]|nr:hypothetical protein [Adiantum nelumboides]